MTKAESDLIITEQNKSTEEILKAIAKVKSDYHELCKLKDKRIAELEDKLANADYQSEGRDIKIKELEHQLTHRNCLDCSNHSSKLRMRTLELEKENEKLMQMLASLADCETCKHYDEDLEKEDKEPCKNCFYDNSFWELKED